MEGQTDAARREFEEMALPHLDSLYNAALKMARDPAAAEDLVQDTYVRAYRFFSRYERGSNCKAWLFTILKNTFINRYWKARSTPQSVSFDAIEGHVEGEIVEPYEQKARNPEEQVSDARLGDAVRSALETLPPDHRMVVILSLVEGYTYKEIASIMSCPIGTVMSRLFRARKVLQSALADHALERGMIERDDGRVVEMTDPGKYDGRF
ncbi:MAG: sigma-70 family RNA polymerase sigma factor [Acidobacteria bacterium]|nr:sigma-70 family RNA polymerase sigma factor [Acidobacteriota bacterium]